MTNMTTPVSSDVLFLADNPALDFINSEYGTGDQRHDCFTDDETVLSWLEAAGLLPRTFEGAAPQGLLALARQLRDSSREVITAAMSGVAAELSVINHVLEAGRPLRALEWEEGARAFRMVSSPRDTSPASLLAPVAESLASLITHEKFEFVRQCEAHDCVLLFHDLTKSHRRRWCSMATCGNRMKVAAFRSRNKPQ
ncbi:ABATE domain-containing protein [Pseudomonas sp. R1-18]